MWTVGDELTLLSSVQHHGLGNWSEIGERQRVAKNEPRDYVARLRLV